MIFILLSIAAAALTAQPADEGREMPVVEVHEWGVIIAEGPGAVMAAHPAGEADPATLYMPGDVLVDRAPVVYFYGPPFTGRFRVEAVSGGITTTWPVPSSEPATWRITADWAERDSAPVDVITGRVHPSTIDGWDATGWRVPQSMTLVTGEGYVDKFLYYECTVDPDLLPLQPAETGVDIAEGFEDMPVALLIPSCAGVTVMPLHASVLENPVELMRNSALVSGDLLPILYGWSRDIVDVEEVDALWGSWRSMLMSEGLPSPESGRALVVYPVPESILEGISRLELETDEGYTVEYDRFILCVMEVSFRGE